MLWWGKGNRKKQEGKEGLDAAILRSLKLCWGFLQLLESLK